MEIIVVDNGSVDGTREVVQRFPVTLLHAAKRGPAAARNAGLRIARAPIIAHLDADTVPSRRWLVELLKPFADPCVIIAAGNTQCYPPQTAAERYIAAHGLYETSRAVNRQPFAFAPSLNMAVRRAAAIAAGGWNEDMLTAEDVDFSYRILKLYGSRIAYAQDAVLFHRSRSDANSLRRQAWTYGEGAADVYRRYPDVVKWDWPKTIKLANRLAVRSALPLLLSAGRLLGIASAQQVELAHYQRLWNWSFWGGFFSMYRTGHRRAA
jgi:cellulose synthase/poly-beta-1,6-N-acetylglucosamine synthase-like glycosyltransferase